MRKYECAECGAPCRYKRAEFRQGKTIVGHGLGTWRPTCSHRKADGKARVKVRAS